MFCKECGEDISPDCALMNGICVFCYHKTDEWESNGNILKKEDAIVNYRKLLKGYIVFCNKTLENIKELYKKLPKGSFHSKIRGNHKYYYLAYREGRKVKFDYIGKEISEKLKEKVNKGKKIRKKLLKKEKEIKRILYQIREIERPGTNYNRFKILKRDDFTCQYCGKKAPDVELEVDHVIPVSKGGKDKPSNLKTVCIRCNREKNMWLLERRK